MKTIILKKDNNNRVFLYEQLYLNIKEQIVMRHMLPGEKCPSIRTLADNLSISVTTVMQAYNQLTAEGYINNRPGSGYYVAQIETGSEGRKSNKRISDDEDAPFAHLLPKYMYDTEAFDFNRWKKCASKIYTEYSGLLLYESDPKGEPELRKEIAKYLMQSRGVETDPENIIIAAGTQQIIFHLSRMLKKTQINLISLEKPGYAPVKSMFCDAGFTCVDIPVSENGIDIEVLPENLSCAVYVNPSNQFPTGVIMPAARRYDILAWAEKNKGYIIEDDYNSELKYIGKPMPTIKSLDSNGRVIYLGSFSSTLFSAIKISYMVVPDELSEIFEKTKKNYSQTCSKAEQLTLAYYMSEGYYYTAIKKKRTLFTKKLKAVTDAFLKYGNEGITLINTDSGLFVTVLIEKKRKSIIRKKSDNDGITDYIKAADKLKVYTAFLSEISSQDKKYFSLYYNLIPLKETELTIKNLLKEWGRI